MEPGDLVLALFPFSETEDGKFRPALVWDVTPVSAKLVFVTSKKLVAAFETEVVLNDKEAASIGLHRAGKLDFGKRAHVPHADVCKVIGHLSGLSRQKLREAMKAAQAAGLLD